MNVGVEPQGLAGVVVCVSVEVRPMVERGRVEGAFCEVFEGPFQCLRGAFEGLRMAFEGLLTSLELVELDCLLHVFCFAYRQFSIAITNSCSGNRSTSNDPC